MIKVNDLFCGCGGIGLGFKEAGYETAGAWDYDKYAVQSYIANVDSIAMQADITQMTYEDMPKADVWTFGFPCQAFSIAGKQLGIKFKCTVCGHEEEMLGEEIIDRNTKCSKCQGESKAKDMRGILLFEVMRLLKHTRNNTPQNLPGVILAENVKGLKPYIPVLVEEYRKRGYRAYVQLYNSKYWGVPQNRERYFIVGVREDIAREFIYPVQQTEFVPKLSSILEQRVDEKYYIADDKAQKIIEQAMLKLERLGSVHATLTPDRLEKRQNGRRAKEEEEMFTLTRQDIHGIIQCAFTDKDNVAYCADANYAKGISPMSVWKNKRTHIVECKETKIIAIGSMQAHAAMMVDISPTVASAAGTSGGNTIMITVKVREATKKGYAEATIGDSINIAQPNSKTRRGRVGKQIAQTLLTGCEQVTICPIRYRLRKLTPTEYGWLQGFPMATWEQVVSNSQAYKQFGNAVTVTVAKAMATAIKEFLEQRETGKVKEKEIMEGQMMI